MCDRYLEVRSLAAVALMWTATSAVAGPVIYASADRAKSNGTEIYVIDPIAATITMLKGIGIGAGGGGTYGGAYAGGGYGSTSSGAEGTAGGLAAGDFSHFAPAGLSGSLFRGPAPIDTHSSDDPITTAELITPNTEATDIEPAITSMPAWQGSQPSSFGGSGRKLAATPSPQFGPSIGCASDCDELAEHASARSLLSLNPGLGCTGDCKDLFGDPLFAPTLLASCISNCGGEVSSLAQGALQISAVPEPSLLGLLGVGFATVGVARRRKTLKP